MNEPGGPLFEQRQTVTLELPLGKHPRILHPEQVVLKVANSYIDIGALCFAIRSQTKRKHRQPQEVVTSSLIIHRPKEILGIIKALSALKTDVGKSIETVAQYAWHIARFINWADDNELRDCLAGGEATRSTFRAWAAETYERYRQQQFGENAHNNNLSYVCELLEATTGLDNLMRGIRKVKRKTNPNAGTEPLALHCFTHAVALNQSIFDGLCDLVLENRPFPYKLELPCSLGWSENHLWVFPTNRWRLPPHLWSETSRRTKLKVYGHWAYDYQNGRTATVDEIEHHYGRESNDDKLRRREAERAVKSAASRINEANADAHNTWRFTLGMVAQRAFLFLFVCNTGCNTQVARDLETVGSIDASVQNQKFRGLKWRADGKEVVLITPVTFLPRLRRFMELRQYLLGGRKTSHLFFSCGNRNSKPPARFGRSELDNLYRKLLLDIDPQLPKLGARTLRASVDDYYLRLHGSVVAAAVMGHTVETEQKNYARGSAIDHHEEMTLFMASVSESARRQRVISPMEVTPEGPPLEQGGQCISFGTPEALAVHPPIRPDCKDPQGCLFCHHRVLIAGEEDARKIASAAYIMEQLIIGPKHEEAMLPAIAKCDEDLEKIAAFPTCRAMVERVRKDVFENENLTPFWADKYQLFIELGVL